MTDRFCPHCKVYKPPTEFHKDNSRPCGLQSWCKDCREPMHEEENRVRVRDLNLRSRYGVTLEQKKQMLEEQDYKCANLSCRKDLVLVGKTKDKSAGVIAGLDHCHITKKVRGLLCKGCNAALGLVNDSSIVLQGLINYLGGVKG